jgi:hypothetical protein
MMMMMSSSAGDDGGLQLQQQSHLSMANALGTAFPSALDASSSSALLAIGCSSALGGPSGAIVQ